MKRSLAMLLALVMCVGLMAGCAKEEPQNDLPDASPEAPVPQPEPKPQPEAKPEPEQKPEEPVTVRLGGLKSPASMGLVKLLDDAENKLTQQEYTFQMGATPPELMPSFLKGELDVLIAPVNMAATFYNSSKGALQMLAVNTLGVLYVLDTGDTVTDIRSLKGQTIYTNGKGMTPEYVLRYLLKENGLDPDKDVELVFKTEATEVVAQLKQTGGIAMLPQPFATVAQTQIPGLRVALDMTAEWDKLNNGSRLLTGCMMVRKEFAQQHPQAVETLLKEYEASTAYANEHTKEAAQLVQKYGITKAPVAEKAMPRCNIVCISGAEMKEMASGYLQTLFDADPKAVGGAMPADDFYYGG